MLKRYQYKIKADVVSNQGNVRTNNEDNFFLNGQKNPDISLPCEISEIYNIKNNPIFAIFDGMGGESYGEISSNLAAQTLIEYKKKISSSSTDKLKKCVNEFVHQTNEKIFDMVKSKNCYNSGTTLAMLCFKNNMAFPFYIGDSRIYFFDGNDLYRLTIDHTLANHKFKTGVYTLEEAEFSSDRNKLTQFVGSDKLHLNFEATSQKPIHIYPGYKFLICSDGLTDMCNDFKIYQILSKPSENYAKDLVEMALIEGGIDNVTAIVLEIL